MFDIVLFQPEIPPNTGNIMRLCVNAPARLHLIEPLGFRLDERSLRRAGMDYRGQTDYRCHRDLEACREALGDRRWVALSARGQSRLDSWDFEPDDVLLFGSETRGLPDAELQALPPERRLFIPQCPGARSLNLSNAVAVVLYEAWRQQAFAGAADPTPRG
ncbi:tRNA (cytidine(34)-2'-O)-methyltransferase [Wenzhouxiangella limi]|uniref:tRNA (cytidine(34)-2'-O)-methyltransferase n=1 Tax=Wenzhouxiangella limi TaxID=2707351 RepID=A0A845V0H0_9GAMM|nr:tRNA (cytidine(34)-2'-O)-methyltransferase [Wenzhouxiangella limi]NDY94786.1 tRNA (cytidine(34)-2'-O)-methyltransferase [Wenzhouxiangella limi]